MAQAFRIYPARRLIRAAFLPAVALFSQATSLLADALMSGEARLDLDESAWDSLASGLGAAMPVLRLDAFFDQAAGNARRCPFREIIQRGSHPIGNRRPNR